MYLETFNIHHKDWLNHSGQTGRSGRSQTNLLRWLAFLLRSLIVILTVLLFWISFSSDTSICSTLAFPALGNSDHVVISVPIAFPLNLQWDAPCHCIAYEYSHTDWDSLHDNWRDASWEHIFKLSASDAASEFCEWAQVRIDVYIPHQKYQVKPHSSP